MIFGNLALWPLFLHVRHALILQFIAEGKNYVEIAIILSMDPTQVQLISLTELENAPRKVVRADFA